MSRASLVVISTRPSGSGAAATVTGVRSGAWRIAATARPRRRGRGFREGVAPYGRGLNERRQGGGAADRLDRTVEEARHVLAPGLGRRVAQLEGRAGRRPAVEREPAVGREQPQPGAGDSPEAPRERRAARACRRDRVRHQHGADECLLATLCGQPLAKRVEVEDRPGEHQQREEVDRHNALAERPAARPGELQPVLGRGAIPR
jgi:hypothetical protein